MFTNEGKIKLIDFGLSFFDLLNTSCSTTNKTIIGTIGYTSPEIINCLEHSFSTDYWSLGVILIELMTGIPPFNDNSIENTQKNILIGNYSKDFIQNSSIEFQDLVFQLLDPNPSTRIGYNSINEIKNHKWFNNFSWKDFESIEINSKLKDKINLVDQEILEDYFS